MKSLFLVSFITVSAVCSFAQPVLTAAAPAEAGMSSDRLNRIDGMVQQYIDSQWIAGGTAIVARNGKIVYHKAFGSANLDTKRPEKVDDIFRIASQTKAITSVAIMILLEDGKLLLDDRLSKYFPAFANVKVLDKFNEADSSFTTVKAKRQVTIRDLLTHTSGISYAQIGSPEANAMFAKAGVHAQLGVPVDDWRNQLSKIATVPLVHQPGERWSYGLNSDILGFLVQEISGMSLADFFRTRIFQPLGMNDTWFYLPQDKLNRLVALHEEDSLGKVHVMRNTRPPFNSLDIDYPLRKGNLYSGGGGLVSTAYDYAIFMQMVLNGGTYNGKRILSKNSVDMMKQNQIGDLSVGKDKFGLGFGIVTQEGTARIGQGIGSFSWGGAFSSTYWIDPEEKIVAQFFLNQYGQTHGEIHDKFKVMVYSALE